MSFENPEVKKEIEQEGFEDNAAVVFGTKEEAERKREVIEKEGYAENLGTYIRMHKEIVVPAEELNPSTRTSAKVNMGLYTLRSSGSLGWCVKFYDKSENIARVYLDFDKIGELKEIAKEGAVSKLASGIEARLKELGFKPAININLFESTIHKYEEKLAEQAKEQKLSEFDF